MLKILILSVGKKHDAELVGAIEHYEKRLTHYAKVEWQFVPSSSVDQESSEILAKLKPTDRVVLLDETGDKINNTGLAELIEKTQNQAVSRLALVIGGAYGVNNEVKARADNVLSLSGLVFPHQLVRLILVEQLYRSYSILSGGKYHHE